MAQEAPKPPTGLRRSGRALWRAVMRDYELDEHETTILREACRTVDAIDSLQTRLDDDGPMSQSPQGSRVHPVLPELRQQRIALARLITALRIPTEGDSTRTQTRGTPRGVYGIKGSA